MNSLIFQDALELIAQLVPGSTATAELVRNGEPMVVAVEVAAAGGTRLRSQEANGSDRLGFTLSALSEAQRRRLRNGSRVFLPLRIP